MSIKKSTHLVIKNKLHIKPLKKLHEMQKSKVKTKHIMVLFLTAL